MERSKRRLAYILIIPAIVFVLAFIIYPVVDLFRLSFTDKVLTDPESGDNFPYKHGITWYEVLGEASLQNLTSSSGGEWRVEHHMP